MNLPSTELLSAILSKTVTHIQNGKESNELCFMVNGETHGVFLNIYELTFKCKEWVLTTGYFLESGLPYKTRATSALFNDYGGFKEGFEAPSEPEAIFLACQYILDSQTRTS